MSFESYSFICLTKTHGIDGEANHEWGTSVTNGNLGHLRPTVNLYGDFVDLTPIQHNDSKQLNLGAYCLISKMTRLIKLRKATSWHVLETYLDVVWGIVMLYVPF